RGGDQGLSLVRRLQRPRRAALRREHGRMPRRPRPLERERKPGRGVDARVAACARRDASAHGRARARAAARHGAALRRSTPHCIVSERGKRMKEANAMTQAGAAASHRAAASDRREASTAPEIFKRHPDNPILTVDDLDYRANSVFNPAAAIVNGETILLL